MTSRVIAVATAFEKTLAEAVQTGRVGVSRLALGPRRARLS